MVLNLPESFNLFKRDKREKDIGIRKEKRHATIIVAKDGTGDTDDIQEAVNLLPPDGGIVHVKEGIYDITSRIFIDNDNVSINGTGRGTKITTSENIQMIYINGKTGVIISNLWLYGAGSGNTTNEGIFNFGGPKVKIHDVWIENCGDNGIRVSAGATSTTLVNNIIHDNFGAGIQTFVGVSLLITGNEIFDNAEHGIYLRDSWDCTINSNSSYANTDNDIELDEISLTSASHNLIVGNRTRDGATVGTILIDTGVDKTVCVANVANVTDNGTGSIVANNAT